MARPPPMRVSVSLVHVERTLLYKINIIPLHKRNACHNVSVENALRFFQKVRSEKFHRSSRHTFRSLGHSELFFGPSSALRLVFHILKNKETWLKLFRHNKNLLSLFDVGRMSHLVQMERNDWPSMLRSTLHLSYGRHLQFRVALWRLHHLGNAPIRPGVHNTIR